MKINNIKSLGAFSASNSGGGGGGGSDQSVITINTDQYVMDPTTGILTPNIDDLTDSGLYRINLSMVLDPQLPAITIPYFAQITGAADGSTLQTLYTNSSVQQRMKDPVEGWGSWFTTSYDNLVKLDSQGKIPAEYMTHTKSLASPVTLEDDTIAEVYGNNNAITISLPSNIPTRFISQITFTSYSNTTFTYPNTIYFNGDDCDNGVFTPVPNRRYIVLFTSAGNGSDVFAFVASKPQQ